MADDDFKKLEEVGSFPSGKGNISVIIFQYGNTPPKIKMQRNGKKRDDTTYFSDVTSLTAEEALQLSPLLRRAAERLRALYP